jgi:hypothetical protein
MAAVLAISAKTRDIGGFAVRRALPAVERRMVGPFVFLDQMGPTRLGPEQRLDVRPHPHIGLSTMTYLLEGEVLHRDSLGTVQMIRPGAMNWMTAGSGITHSERTPEQAAGSSTLSGIQFWVALPKSHEEMAPAFVHLEAGELPVVEDQEVSVRTIAGEAFGVRSPLSAPHPMICLDVAMKPGARLQLPTDYPEQALYVALGEVELTGVRYGQGQLLVLPNDGLTVRAISDTRLLLLGGESMDGRRHMWWNFVSSSKDRIEQAKQDWKQGRFSPVPGETEFIPLPE